MAAISARFLVRREGFTLDVDLTLPARGITAVFGHSGCGKTTLLRCIAGLERAPGGCLTVSGERWQDDTHWVPTHRRPIGYVFQEASLFPHLTVLRNLRYGLRGRDSAQHSLLDPIIDLLDLRHLLGRQPEHLSGGERQRVAIARALAASPRILLLDEPLSALDWQRKREILPYLDRLHDQLEIPVIYVTHSLDEVARLADHLLVLSAGATLACGPLSETLARPDLPFGRGDDAGTVIVGTIGAVDTDWHLVRVDFQGGHLWTSDQGAALGRQVRVRVLARDVSLAVRAGDSSVQNVLKGIIQAVGDDDHPAIAMVRIQVGEAVVLSRLTRRAADQLQLSAGQEVFAQVKSVALLC